MTRFRILTMLILFVGLASLFPADILWPRVRQHISEHDGIAHATAYGLLSLTACWAVWPAFCAEPHWRPAYRRRTPLARLFRAIGVLLGVVVTLSLLGALVELLQDVLHTHRNLSRDDLIANTIGALTGSVLWLAILATRYVIQ